MMPCFAYQSKLNEYILVIIGGKKRLFFLRTIIKICNSLFKRVSVGTSDDLAQPSGMVPCCGESSPI